jgi:cytoskeleton protein RodZ
MSDAEGSAGALLRAAREKQGLHIAALAMMLKVPPRKLEALEADRYDEFQGATFVRALAQAACRTLKIDPAPVLDRLPEQDSGTLSQLERGLNTPFREHGARRDSADVPALSRAILGLVVVLLLGAMAFLLWPAGWHLPKLPVLATAPEPATVSTPVALPGAGSVSEPTFSPAPLAVESAASGAVPTGTVTSAPASAPTAAATSMAAMPAPPADAARTTAPVAASAAPTSTGRSMLQLTARRDSWVEVVDGRAQVLLARTLTAGEAVSVDGALPLRVKIGNVSGTDLSFQGRPVDLAAVARDNVAKLELK